MWGKLSLLSGYECYRSNPVFLDSLTSTALWSCAELSFGVISACLPSLTTLFLTLLGKRPSRSRGHSLSLSRRRDGVTRNDESNLIAVETDRITRFGSLELVTGSYPDLGDPNYVHEDAGSILVTHRVDQVMSRKMDQLSRAEEVGMVADGSKGDI